MIHVFPSLEHSTDCGCKPADNFRTFVCVPYGCRRTKHNRAKPMSELLSALISIADSSEFRFARFNIVYEGAQLVLPESPPIVSGVSDMRPPGVQTWKRHGIRCSHPAGRNTHIFLQRMFHMQFQPKSVSSASCNITYHSKLLTCFVRQLLSDGSVPRSIHMQMPRILP